MVVGVDMYFNDYKDISAKKGGSLMYLNVLEDFYFWTKYNDVKCRSNFDNTTFYKLLFENDTVQEDQLDNEFAVPVFSKTVNS